MPNFPHSGLAYDKQPIVDKLPCVFEGRTLDVDYPLKLQVEWGNCCPRLEAKLSMLQVLRHRLGTDGKESYYFRLQS